MPTRYRSLEEVIRAVSLEDFTQYMKENPDWHDERLNVDGSECSILGYAARCCKFERFEAIATAYRDAKNVSLPDALKAKDGTGATLLHYAAANSEQQVASWLIDRGANLDAVAKGLRSHEVECDKNSILTLFEPFSAALKAGNIDTIQYYLQQNPTWLVVSKDKHPLEIAVQFGQLQAFISAYENLNPEQQIALHLEGQINRRNPKTPYSRSVVGQWVRENSDEINQLKWMQQQKAQLHGSQDDKNNTLLHLCIYAQNHRVLDAISSGEMGTVLDIFAKNDAGLNPLDLAAKMGDFKALKMLVAKQFIREEVIIAAAGYMPVSKLSDCSDLMPEESKELVNYALLIRLVRLRYAVNQSNIELAKKLVDEEGTPVNIVDENGNTLLHDAAMRSLGMVNWLMNKGLSLKAANQSGQLPETMKRDNVINVIDQHKHTLVGYAKLHNKAKPEVFSKAWLLLDYSIPYSDPHFDPKNPYCNPPEKNTMSLLHVAAYYDNVAALEAIKKALGDEWTTIVNHSVNGEENGLTPLGAAVRGGASEAVHFLLSNDADPSIACIIDRQVSAYPCTPFYYALQGMQMQQNEKFWAIAKHFLSLDPNKIDVNRGCDWGFKKISTGEWLEWKNSTPLRVAIDAGSTIKYFDDDKYDLIISMLLVAGADVSSVCEYRKNNKIVSRQAAVFCASIAKAGDYTTLLPLLNAYVSFIESIRAGNQDEILSFLKKNNPTWLKVNIDSGLKFDIWNVLSKYIGLNSIHIAIVNKKNTVTILQSLLDTYPKVVTPLLTAPDQTKRKRTPLHHASRAGDLASVKWLLQQQNVKKKINAKDAQGNTALHMAVKSESREIADYLLTAGIDAAIKNTADETAKEMSAGVFKSNVLADQAIHFADMLPDELLNSLNINKQELDSVKALLNEEREDEGAIVNAKKLFNTPGADRGRTLFHAAVREGKLKLVKRLIELKVIEDLNRQDNEGNTPLHMAVKSCSRSTTQYLFDRKDVNQTIQNKARQTAEEMSPGFGKNNVLAMINKPFRTAIEKDNLTEVSRLYVEDPRFFDKNPETKLKLAAKKGACRVFKFLSETLIEKTNDTQLVRRSINCREERKRSLAHCIARRGYTDLIPWYVKHGANFRLYSEQDSHEYPLLIAIQKSHLDVAIALIEQKTCNVNQSIMLMVGSNELEETPLFLAAKSSPSSKNNKLVDCLLDAGARPNVQLEIKKYDYAAIAAGIPNADLIINHYYLFDSIPPDSYLLKKADMIFTLVGQAHKILCHAKDFKPLIDYKELSRFYDNVSRLFESLKLSIDDIRLLPKTFKRIFISHQAIYKTLLAMPEDDLLKVKAAVESNFSEYLSAKGSALKTKLAQDLDAFITLVETGGENSRWRKTNKAVRLLEKGQAKEEAVSALLQLHDNLLDCIRSVVSFRIDDKKPISKENFNYRGLSAQNVRKIISNLQQIFQEFPRLEAELVDVKQKIFESQRRCYEEVMPQINQFSKLRANLPNTELKKGRPLRSLNWHAESCLKAIRELDQFNHLSSGEKLIDVELPPEFLNKNEVHLAKLTEKLQENIGKLERATAKYKQEKIEKQQKDVVSFVQGELKEINRLIGQIENILGENKKPTLFTLRSGNFEILPEKGLYGQLKPAVISAVKDSYKDLATLLNQVPGKGIYQFTDARKAANQISPENRETFSQTSEQLKDNLVEFKDQLITVFDLESEKQQAYQRLQTLISTINENCVTLNALLQIKSPDKRLIEQLNDCRQYFANQTSDQLTPGLSFAGSVEDFSTKRLEKLYKFVLSLNTELTKEISVLKALGNLRQKLHSEISKINNHLTVLSELRGETNDFHYSCAQVVQDLDEHLKGFDNRLINSYEKNVLESLLQKVEKLKPLIEKDKKTLHDRNKGRFFKNVEPEVKKFNEKLAALKKACRGKESVLNDSDEPNSMTIRQSIQKLERRIARPRKNNLFGSPFDPLEISHHKAEHISPDKNNGIITELQHLGALLDRQLEQVGEEQNVLTELFRKIVTLKSRIIIVNKRLEQGEALPQALVDEWEVFREAFEPPVIGANTLLRTFLDLEKETPSTSTKLQPIDFDKKYCSKQYGVDQLSRYDRQITQFSEKLTQALKKIKQEEALPSTPLQALFGQIKIVISQLPGSETIVEKNFIAKQESKEDHTLADEKQAEEILETLRVKLKQQSQQVESARQRALKAEELFESAEVDETYSLDSSSYNSDDKDFFETGEEVEEITAIPFNGQSRLSETELFGSSDDGFDDLVLDKFLGSTASKPKLQERQKLSGNGEKPTTLVDRPSAIEEPSFWRFSDDDELSAVEEKNQVVSDLAIPLLQHQAIDKEPLLLQQKHELKNKNSAQRRKKRQARTDSTDKNQKLIKFLQSYQEYVLCQLHADISEDLKKCNQHDEKKPFYDLLKCVEEWQILLSERIKDFTNCPEGETKVYKYGEYAQWIVNNVEQVKALLSSSSQQDRADNILMKFQQFCDTQLKKLEDNKKVSKLFREINNEPEVVIRIKNQALVAIFESYNANILIPLINAFSTHFKEWEKIGGMRTVERYHFGQMRAFLSKKKVLIEKLIDKIDALSSKGKEDSEYFKYMRWIKEEIEAITTLLFSINKIGDVDYVDKVNQKSYENFQINIRSTYDIIPPDTNLKDKTNPFLRLARITQIRGQKRYQTFRTLCLGEYERIECCKEKVLGLIRQLPQNSSLHSNNEGSINQYYRPTGSTSPYKPQSALFRSSGSAGNQSNTKAQPSSSATHHSYKDLTPPSAAKA